MLQISAIQLAELLAGIGRAQAAMVQGLENEMAGVRSGRVVPAVQNAAHLRDHPEPTLVDLPVRVFLNSLGRIPPDPAVIARDLERPLATRSTSASRPRSPGLSRPDRGILIRTPFLHPGITSEQARRTSRRP